MVSCFCNHFLFKSILAGCGRYNIEIHGAAIFHRLTDDHLTLGGLPFHEDIGCKAHVCVLCTHWDYGTSRSHENIATEKTMMKLGGIEKREAPLLCVYI